MFRRSAAVDGCDPELRGGNVTGKVGEERDAFAVGRPGQITEWKLAFEGYRMGRAASGGNYRDLAFHDVGDLRSVGGDRSLADTFGAGHGVEHGGGMGGWGLLLREKEGACEHAGKGRQQRKKVGSSSGVHCGKV